MRREKEREREKRQAGREIGKGRERARETAERREKNGKKKGDKQEKINYGLTVIRKIRERGVVTEDIKREKTMNKRRG